MTEILVGIVAIGTTLVGVAVLTVVAVGWAIRRL